MKKDESVVAVLDILGYSQLMEHHSIDEMESLVVNGLLESVRVAKLVTGEAIVVSHGGEIQEMSQLVEIDYGVISDTIVLFPLPTAKSPLTSLCASVAILMSMLIDEGIVLRGAIYADTFRAIKGQMIYVGKAILGAHRLEIKQEWAGCSLSGRIARKFPKEFRELQDSGLLVRYQVPFKGEGRETRSTHWVVNWFYYQLGSQVKKVRTLIKLRDQAPEDSREKLVATLAFWEHLNQRNLSWREPLTKLIFDLAKVGGTYRFAPKDSMLRD